MPYGYCATRAGRGVAYLGDIAEADIDVFGRKAGVAGVVRVF